MDFFWQLRGGTPDDVLVPIGPVQCHEGTRVSNRWPQCDMSQFENPMRSRGRDGHV
jgi:hypothetical protein